MHQSKDSSFTPTCGSSHMTQLEPNFSWIFITKKKHFFLFQGRNLTCAVRPTKILSLRKVCRSSSHLSLTEWNKNFTNSPKIFSTKTKSCRLMLMKTEGYNRTRTEPGSTTKLKLLNNDVIVNGLSGHRLHWSTCSLKFADFANK